MDGKLTKEEIIKLFIELNRKLNKNNQMADLLICGGASMTLLYDETIATKDIDGCILTTDIKSEITKYVEQIGNEQNIDEDWFNEAAKGFIDLSWEKEEVIKYSNLTVYSVKAKQLLAMKLTSARIDTRDDKDAIKLMRYMDIGSAEELLDILERSFGTWALSAKLQYHTLDLYERYEEEKKMENKSIYIRIPKSFVRKDVPSKSQEGKTYNKVTLPSNAKIADQSVGGFSFYPLYVNEDKYSDKLYNIPLLAGQQVQLNKDGQKIMVQPEDIKSAVETSYKEYANEAKKAMDSAATWEWEKVSFEDYCKKIVADELDEMEGQVACGKDIGLAIVRNMSISEEPFIILEGKDQSLQFIARNINEAKDIYEQREAEMENPLKNPEVFQAQMVETGVNNLLGQSAFLQKNMDAEIALDKKVVDQIKEEVGINPAKEKSITKNAEKSKGAELE